jgi:hypothetical protein
MIVSYLVSRLALSDSKDFISKNFLKLLIINIILKVLPFAVLIIGLSLYSSSMLDASKIPSILGTIYFFILLGVFLVFVPIINYIYEKSIVYFIARKENDKYRTFLKWAILDMSIIKSIKSFIGYILIYIFYVIVTSGTIFVVYFVVAVATLSRLLLPDLFLPIVIVIILILYLLLIFLLLTFIPFLGSYTSKSYFFTRVSNPSNWSSLKMAFSSISRKVIKRILKLVLYALIITITLLAILFVMGFVGLLNLNLILFVIIGIYLFTEFVAYNIISDLYILNMIKTNSQSEMSQNAEQSK